jgi:hypothetical protein
LKIKNRTEKQEEAVVAVVVSIARGHDASCPFETTGAADCPVITEQCGEGYYPGLGQARPDVTGPATR